MIIADTSVWVDHLRSSDGLLASLLDRRLVLQHPFVLGEIAMGLVKSRELLIEMFEDLPEAITATDREVLDFVERHSLFGIGVGYLDAHLLVATRLTPEATLWTRDKRLRAVAERLRLNAKVVH